MCGFLWSQTIFTYNKQFWNSMQKRFLFVALALVAALTMTAQEVDKAKVTGNADAAKKAGDALKGLEEGEKAWKFDGTLGLNAAATGLVNWAAGGKNNVNGIAFVKLHLLYHKNNIAWETNFDTDFGLTWIQQKEDPLQKSSDNIKLATKFGWEFHKDFYLTVLGSFQSQYALGRQYQDGYNSIISKWLAPSYTDISVGIDYKHSVNGADFSVYLSPIAGRITTAYTGNTWNERYTKEMWLAGNTTQTEADWTPVIYRDLKDKHQDLRSMLQDAHGTIGYDQDGNKVYRNARAEYFKLSTTLALFTPYQGKGFNVYEKWLEQNPGKGKDDYYQAGYYFDDSNNNRYFGMFDVDWDVALSYQFLKCLQVTLQTSLKYYPGTLIAAEEGGNPIERERVQFKGILGIGVGYSF